MNIHKTHPASMNWKIFLLFLSVNVGNGQNTFNHWQPITKQWASLNQAFVRRPLAVVNSNDLGSSNLYDVGVHSSRCPFAPKLATEYFIRQSFNGQDDPLCPIVPPKCEKSKYRTLDGTCNNLDNPSWGAAVSRYGRLLAPIYSDGVSAIPLAKSGNQLPNARLISLIVFGDADVTDPDFTLATMQWGQLVTHDMSITAVLRQSNLDEIRCCGADGRPVQAAHRACFPITLPRNDPYYSKTNKQCMTFMRTQTDLERNCPGQKGAAEQLTDVTAYLDLSLVYGNSVQQLGVIRAFHGGRMLVDQRFGQDWPPPSPTANTTCDGNPGEPCYLFGDPRANQDPGLTILQIVLLREHNLLADGLKKLNPHWDDEKLFQEARQINIAAFQHITYWEWLPILLGEENMAKNRLLYNDYDPRVDPSVLNEHATAAFRYFHSQIEGWLDLVSESYSRIGSLRLSDWFNRPVILEHDHNFDSLAKGLATQHQQLTDINFDKEIKHFLFRSENDPGSDLHAFDIHRNRDHGLATYNDYREFCGLPRAHQWNDYLDLLSPEKIANLRSLYESHEDVDLTVGASLESHMEGTLAGPTFLCIMTEQFFRTRVGDRFFYEHMDTALTKPQLQEVRKSSLARLLCNNVQKIHTIQRQAFRKISIKNLLVPCKLIPAINLAAWKDRDEKQ